MNAGHLDIIPKTSVGIAISIIVIWTPFHETSVEIVINIIVLWTPFREILCENCYLYYCPVDTVQQILCGNCYIYIVIWTPFHKSSVGIVIYLLLSSGHRSTKPLYKPFAKLEVNSGYPECVTHAMLLSVQHMS